MLSNGCSNKWIHSESSGHLVRVGYFDKARIEVDRMKLGSDKC
jgi:hypothetical protein